MSTIQLERYTLLDLAARYFQSWKCQVEWGVRLEGQSGTRHFFDLLLTDRSRVRRVVWVKDWERSVGVNVALSLDVASADVKLPNPIVVAKEFSEDAKSYAKRRKVTLLKKREILEFLNAHAF